MFVSCNVAMKTRLCSFYEYVSPIINSSQIKQVVESRESSRETRFSTEKMMVTMFRGCIVGKDGCLLSCCIM